MAVLRATDPGPSHGLPDQGTEELARVFRPSHELGRDRVPELGSQPPDD